MPALELSKTLAAAGQRKRKRDWEAFLGDAFQTFGTCLRKTGAYVRHVRCGLCGCNHEVIPSIDGEGFIACCRCDDRGCDDIALSKSDAQAWALSAADLGEMFGRSLGVAEPARVRDEGQGLFDLGECPRHSGRLHVWLCACPERLLQDRIARLLKRNDVGCVLVAGNGGGGLSQAERLGVAVVSVSACFSVGKKRVSGDCGERCKEVESSRVVTRSHFDQRVDALGQEVGTVKLENMRLKAELAQNILNVVKKADPDFIRNVMCVLAAGSVNKAAKRLGIPNSTFSGKLKQRAAERASHQAMYRMIQMRQRSCGVKSIERFNETWADHQGAQGADSIEALLKAVVEGLEKMSPGNFSVVRDELIKECAPFL